MGYIVQRIIYILLSNKYIYCFHLMIFILRFHQNRADKKMIFDVESNLIHQIVTLLSLTA